MNYNDFLEKCYEKYKLDWCEQRNTCPEDIDEDIGINGGECYVCISEFECCEFQEEDVMAYLLSENEYELWKLAVNKLLD